MQISNIPGNNTAGIEKALEEYGRQVDSKLIVPEWFSLYKSVDIKEDDGLLVDKSDSGIIRGMVHYTLVDPEEQDLATRIESFFQDYDILFLRDSGENLFRNYRPSKPLLYIKDMETFPKRNGIGKTLINHLIQSTSPEVIFLTPKDDVAIKAYQRMGLRKEISFNKSGVRVMLWLNPK